MSDLSYIQKNDGYITASKLKTYQKNPEDYYLQYFQKIQIEEEKRHYIIGTAFDDLVSYRITYGNNQKYHYEKDDALTKNPFADIVEGLQVNLRTNDKVNDDMVRLKVWLDKYYLDEGLVTDELKAKILNVPGCYGLSDQAIKNMKLPELRKFYYRDPNNRKIRLTPAESRDIMGMYREVLRQTRMDMMGRRGVQVQIENEYMGAKIRGTLDRFILVDKDDNRYLPEEAKEYIKEKGFASRQNLVKELGIKGIIRDRKTSGNMDTFEYDMEENFGYTISMSFYYVLALVEYGVKSEVFLDVLSKKDPFGSFMYRLRPEIIIDKIQNTIKPLMEDLIRAYDHDIWEPIKPLTGEPVSRGEMMKSKYYPYMKGAIQTTFQNPV